MTCEKNILSGWKCCIYRLLAPVPVMFMYHMTSSPDDSDGGEDEEQEQPLDQLKDKLRELTEAHDLVLKHGHTMLRQLSDIEGDQLVVGTMTKVKEKIAMFKLTTGAMMTVSVV